MKRSRKQAEREALTADQVRQRAAHKAMEADRALWIAVGGQVAWQAELDRRRAERTRLTRERVREITARRQAAEQLELFWGEGA